MQILALADDLTGALEVGAKFASRGIPVHVSLTQNGDSSHEVRVIDTESRHLPPAEAVQIQSLALEHAPARLIYKKTDSTLRGNIAAELAALAQAFPDHALHYIPSYPRLGRTVRAGHLYIHGAPVHQTPFANDPRSPVRDSAISAILDGLPCTIHDGDCDADIDRSLQTALATPCILAGPASVAEALAAHLQPNPPAAPPLPHLAKVAIINGSLHPLSTQQITWAIAHGVINEDWRVIKFPPLPEPLDAIIIFGGDTAFATLKAMHCETLEPLGEILPGVPLCRLPTHNLHLITKAGGFGPLDILSQCKVGLGPALAPKGTA